MIFLDQKKQQDYPFIPFPPLFFCLTSTCILSFGDHIQGICLLVGTFFISCFSQFSLVNFDLKCFLFLVSFYGVFICSFLGTTFCPLESSWKFQSMIFFIIIITIIISNKVVYVYFHPLLGYNTLMPCDSFYTLYTIYV